VRSFSGYIRKALARESRKEAGEATPIADATVVADATTQNQSSDNNLEALLKTLPVISEITATTDIRGFLKPGVPESLKHAALRRAWVMDAGIRDFVGIAENQWDFSQPQTIPGFGLLDPAQMRHMVPKLFTDASGGNSHRSADQSESVPLPENSEAAAPPSPGHRPTHRDGGQTNTVAETGGREEDDDGNNEPQSAETGE
jgi:Protein of unknown function (DUF3306)